jgi:hypothetical protein
MPDKDGKLTEKEEAIIKTFSDVRPELGAIAKANILNNEKTGWAEIAAETSDEEVAAGVRQGIRSNSFIYRHIGG